MLFFVSVGMLVNPAYLVQHWQQGAAVSVLVVLGKALTAPVTGFAFPYPACTALVVAAGLSQVGEFSFIVGQKMSGASSLAGRSIAGANLRPRAGVSIVAVGKDGVITGTPAPDVVLHAGDDIAIIGSAAQIDAARRLIAATAP